MQDRKALLFWPLLAWVRLRSAVGQHWKRILAGAAIGWVFATVGGAFALASLEFHHLISQTTSEELGIVIVLYFMGFGALFAYTARPSPQR